jgi:putative ABC transport system permease protein
VTVIGSMLRSLGDDLREAVRRVRRHPRLTLITAGTLALGVGVGTAVFTIAHSILLAPPPFRDPDRLVSLRGRTPGWQMGVSRADLADYRAIPGLFDAAALTNYAEFTWTDRRLPGFDGSEVLRGLVVTDEYFRVFARPMAAGHGFTEDDRRHGRDAVVISHALWLGRFDGRPDVIGTTMTLNGREHTVVGVAGQGFLTYEQYEVQAWATFEPSSDRRSHQYDCYGRLGPAVSIEQAQRGLDATSARLAAAFPESNRDYSVSVSPLLEDLHEQARPAFLALAGAVLCLLLIAVANVASLLLARATVDAREMAIRSALGAGRLRLVRMMTAESLLLAAIACAAGALIGAWLIAGLRSLMPASLQFDWAFAVDHRVFVAAFLLSAVSGLAAGVAPALESFRLAAGGLRPSYHRHRMLRAIVTAEVALAVFLSIGGGLLAKGFVGLLERPLGYRTDHLLGMRVRLQGPRYATVDGKGDYWFQLVERVRTLPGIVAAASVSDLPMGWQYIGGSFEVDSQAGLPSEQRPSAHRLAASPGYFGLVGIPILAGRGIAESDGPAAEPIAIVNDLLAERFWPGQNPIGRMIRSGGGPWRRVVGVVRRIRHGGPDDEYRNEIYMPFRQFNQDTMFLVVRSALPPESIVPAIRSALNAIDPDVPAFEIRTLEQAFVRQIAGPRLLVVLTTGSAAVAALLAALGLFGVMAYWVSQRVKELGVRAALGARPRDLHRVVLLRGGRLMAVGLLCGTAGALAAMRLLRSLLYGVSDRDAPVYAGAISLAVVMAIAACWLPARRAARIDPVEALREEG